MMGHHGLLAALSSGPPYAATKSIDFDGVDAYVSLGTPFSGTTSGSPFTISLWLRASIWSGNFFALGAAPAGLVLPLVQCTASAAYCYNENGYTFVYAPGGGPLGNNTWYHLVIVSTGSGFPTVYINGTARSDGSGASAWTRAGGTAWLWGRYNSATYSFDGNMCELALWHSALNSTQAAAVYNGGTRHNLWNLGTRPDRYWPVQPTDSTVAGSPTIQDFSGAYPGTPVNTVAGDLVSVTP